MAEKRYRPVLSGFLALAVVTAVLGGVLGAAALVGTRALGFGGDQATGIETSDEETLYLPPLRRTASAGQAGRPARPGRRAEQAEPTRTPQRPQTPILLRARPLAVASFEEIQLSGTYRGGAGAALQVQRRQDGGPWEAFPVDTTVDDGPAFDTTVQTARSGVNQWRVIDRASGAISNVVEVRVG